MLTTSCCLECCHPLFIFFLTSYIFIHCPWLLQIRHVPMYDDHKPVLFYIESIYGDTAYLLLGQAVHNHM